MWRPGRGGAPKLVDLTLAEASAAIQGRPATSTDRVKALLDRINTLLFYGQMSAGLRQQILTAVNGVTIPAGTGSNVATAKLNRAKLAVFLSMVSGEYLTQR